jgi:hypothetical protein
MVVQVINPRQFAKNGIGNGRFSVEIIASGFHEPAILILDNLRYEAEECPGIGGEKESIAESAGGKRMPSASFGRIAEAKIFTPKANALPLDYFADDGKTAGKENNDGTNGQVEMVSGTTGNHMSLLKFAHSFNYGQIKVASCRVKKT